jgi:hypothetical protein
MIIKIPHHEFQIPEELKWLKNIIETCIKQQELIGIRQPYCYVTVRHGLVQSQQDDEWHTDGFSTAISHLPEQNYIISDSYPTEYVEKKIKFPNDFNPDKHNIHLYFNDIINDSDIKIAKPNTLYLLDPYIIHRRSKNIPQNVVRTFVRISFTPIEIMDDNNTINPILPMRKYNRDGVIIRNKLTKYNF